ncbi:flagellar basal-body MS-ring/collar protein FliF [Sphingosinicella sp. CPCC 101087]|uniref:flagellar basal-body MS-ring/collar protein FliF n=1 Tax=Sphingosinicella sp. CPCC 101087 TaxID=2497754 RepID=UPI00101CCA0B|nr:flagellar basal-body MS-ring/collar protein FliF [Sphingosinicella sp. CPCC 101087]
MSELAATTDLAPVPRASSAAPGGTTRILQQVRGFAAQPAVAKSLPAIGFILLIGLAAMLWMAFSAPPSRTLFGSLADEEKAAVVEALGASGIAYELDRTTGAVTVSEDDYHQARMLLASRGLPRSGPDGGDVIQNLPLGSSRAVEGERIRSARELDLARTIEAVEAVESARVHLAVEQPSVFVRDRARPAASVMLTLVPGRTLGDAQVQAIVHLVASSVPGLAPDGVSVVDQTGRLLSREGMDGASAASERQITIQSAIEESYRRSIATLLTPVLGEGNFSAEVHADVDFSEVQSTREDFPEDARALQREEGALVTDGTAEPPAGGIPGALSNQAPPAAEVAAQPDGTLAPAIPGAEAAAAAGGRRAENYNRSFALGREVSVTRRQPGAVRRITVAVALRNVDGRPRSAQEIAALERLVKGAVGFDEARGDVVAISAREFAAGSQTQAEQSWWEASWVAMAARNLTALALAALLIFGIGRPLLRRGSAMLSQRVQNARAARAGVGGEIAAVIADQAQHDPSARVTLDMIEAASDYEARAALIRNFVRQDPARAALVVRDLIRTDARNGASRHG